MRNSENNRQGPGEILEWAFFLLLPLVCAASIIKSCGAENAEFPEGTLQTAAGQQYEVTQTNDVKTTDPAESPQEKTGSTEKKVTVRKNHYDPAKFSYLDEISENMGYFDENYESLQGIDVSEHQGEIDWEEVAGAGYDFVFVRVGYRGYGAEGTLNEDTRAIEYMQDAAKAGLEVGAYFFSQAISEEEAAQEAQFAIDIIERSGVRMSLPLVYDPEYIEVAQGRADNLTKEEYSANARAFKEAAEKTGKYKTAIYTNLYWEEHCLDEEVLNNFEVWYADYEETPQTPYHFTWWQYSETGSVPGIKGAMDLNLWIRQVD